MLEMIWAMFAMIGVRKVLSGSMGAHGDTTPGGTKDAILLAGGTSGGILMAGGGSDILMAGQ